MIFEINQTEKEKFCMVSLTGRIKKIKQNPKAKCLTKISKKITKAHGCRQQTGGYQRW